MGKKTIPKEDQQSKLIRAIEHGDMEGVRLAVRDGADINAPGEYGRTPLIKAAPFINEYRLSTLMELGADINKPDIYGDTPLHYSANANSLTPALLRAYTARWGANINAQNKKGEDPLMVAFGRWNFSQDLLRAFIELGVDLRSGNKTGESFLSTCLKRGDAEVVFGSLITLLSTAESPSSLLLPPQKVLDWLDASFCSDPVKRDGAALLILAGFEADHPGCTASTRWKTRKGATRLMKTALNVPRKSPAEAVNRIFEQISPSCQWGQPLGNEQKTIPAGTWVQAPDGTWVQSLGVPGSSDNRSLMRPELSAALIRILTEQWEWESIKPRGRLPRFPTWTKNAVPGLVKILLDTLRIEPSLVPPFLAKRVGPQIDGWAGDAGVSELAGQLASCASRTEETEAAEPSLSF